MAASQMGDVIQHLRRTVLLRDGAGLTDGQLLEDYISRRDDAALAALVRRHGLMVWGVCRRILRNYHDAEDAFQATFLVLVRKAASIAARELLVNWLYGVAHQTALKARATIAKRQARERQVTGMPEPAVIEPHLWNDIQPLLDHELSRLPDKYRGVIVLCDLEGKTRKEAAQQLGLPDGTVGSRLARARAILAKRLARHGLAVSGGSVAAALAQNAASASAPTSLVSSTIKAASLFAAGHAAPTAVISAQVAALSEGVLKTMLLSKLRIATMVLLFVVIVCTGATVLTHQALGAKQTDEKRRDAPTREAKDTDGPGQVGRKWKQRSSIAMPDGESTPGMAISPDGGKIATFHGPKARLWDAATGKKLATLFEYDRSTNAGGTLVFALDGNTLAVVDYKEVKLWDVRTGKELATLSGHTEAIRCLALSGDGKILATGAVERDARALRLWDLVAAKEIVPPNVIKLSDAVMALAFSPDGKTLAAGFYEGEIKLFDAASGKERTAWKGHMDWAMSLAFSPDGKILASGCRDGTVKLWEAATAKELANWQAHTKHTHLAFCPNCKVLATAGHDDDKTVKLWDVTEPDTAKIKEIQTIEDHTGTIWAIAFARDGTLATAGNDAVRLWEPEKRPTGKK